MNGDWTPPPLETLLKQLDDFCSNAAAQMRPLVAQLQESNEDYENQPRSVTYLLDRIEGGASKVLADVMDLKSKVRGLRNQLLEQMAEIE